MENDFMQLRLQIAERIESYIQENNLKPHDRLPSERELCRLWGCSRMTLRSALRRLTNEGLLYSRQGSGTYLAEKKLERNLWQFASLSQALRQSGCTVTNRLVSQKVVGASKKVSAALGVSLGTLVMEIRRLRLADGRTLALEVSYIPYLLCRGLAEENLEEQSLYEVLDKKYGIRLTCSTQEIYITYVSVQEGELMELEPGTPVLMLRGTAFDESKKPVEYSEALTRGDMCDFTSIMK